MSEQKTSASHTLQAAKAVRELVKQMYVEGIQTVLEGKPVAWVMVSLINPILMAMDVVPIMPENWAGLCATKRMAEPYIVRAEQEGYSNVVCSYARIGLGYASMMQECDGVPPDAPDGGMVRPTILIGSSGACDSRFKWFQSLGRYLNVPYHSFDMLTAPSTTAFRKDVRDQYVNYQVQQYRHLIEFIEEHTGHSMDWDRLNHYVDTARETWRIWGEAYELRKAIPCPMPTEDHMNIFVLGWMQEGDPRVLDFFKELYNELRYRADNKIGVIPEEKYRLLWGSGLPPWHTMKIFNYFESLGAVFVGETCYAPPAVVDIPDSVSDPLERMALTLHLGQLEKHRRSIVGGYNFIVYGNPLEWIEEYQADGAVFHWLRSCRGTTIGQIYYQNLIAQHSKVPTLFLEGDMCDVRDYFESEWKDKITAFLETVDVHREAKGQ